MLKQIKLGSFILLVMAFFSTSAYAAGPLLQACNGNSAQPLTVELTSGSYSYGKREAGPGQCVNYHIDTVGASAFQINGYDSDNKLVYSESRSLRHYGTTAYVASFLFLFPALPVLYLAPANFIIINW